MCKAAFPMTHADLTPAFGVDCEGAIHSIFRHAANAMMRLRSGPRMITLAAPRTPYLPDSVRVPEGMLAALQISMPVRLQGDCLRVDGRRIPFVRRECKPVGAYGGCPEADAFLKETEPLASGFDMLPADIRLSADRALLTNDASRYIGLGCGLTPCFDDACVGVLAVCRAMGRDAPFKILGYSATTDVSARYLRLAAEGYFSGPVAALIDALFKGGSIPPRLEDLLAVGATSGSDVVYGIRKALRLLS